MIPSSPVCSDAEEVAVVLRQPCVHVQLLGELTALRDRSIVARTRDVWRTRNDADLVLYRSGGIRDQNVTILRPLRLHVVLLSVVSHRDEAQLTRGVAGEGAR
jgi:hypothetical protein